MISLSPARFPHPGWGTLLRWIVARRMLWPLARAYQTAHLMTRVFTILIGIAAVSRFWHVASLGIDARSDALEPPAGIAWRRADSEPTTRYVTWVERVIASVSPWHVVAVSMVAGSVLRLWRLDAVGYNSDEAVYAGQAAALAGDPNLSAYFPIFRAHPMVFQFTLSLAYHAFGVHDLTGRSLVAIFGLMTVLLVYKIGAALYDRWTGALAASLLALMPYHVIVTRQVLLDGPLAFCTTLTLLLLTKYALTERNSYLMASGAALGLTFLTKETGIILAGAVFAFFLLHPEIRIQFRGLVAAGCCMMIPVLTYPLSIVLTGRGETAQNYLIWQLLRPSNHAWTFFPTVVPPAIGWLVLLAAGAGLVLLRKQRSWRETLLVCWILVPTVFFQLWPVKGFQYLLPIAPAVAILCARLLVHWRPGSRHISIPFPSANALLTAIVLVSLLVPTTEAIVGDTGGTSRLAGAGGIPGVRETGYWIDENLPENAILVTIGPSMSNMVQFYGH
jgi:hypothetical protein